MIAITTNGYIKRTTVDTYRTQNRGGKGVKGMSLNSDDMIDQMINMSTHDDLLLFTNFGKVYRIKGYRVPNASRIAKGMPVVNLLDLDEGEKVKAMIDVTPDPELENKYLLMVTVNGLVKRVEMKEFLSIRQSGKIAIQLKDDDMLFGACLTTGNDEIIIAGSNGKAIRFNENDVRPMGRNAAGVIGFNTDGGVVVGMATSDMGSYILSVTEKGYGKKTPLEDYRLTKRGGKGVGTISVTEKNGPLVSVRAVDGNEDALMMTDDGTIIRISLNNVAEYGRTTMGVRLIAVNDSKVATVTIVDHQAEQEESENTEVPAETIVEENKIEE